MPNTRPRLDNKSQIEFIINRSKKSIVDLYPSGYITMNCDGKEIVEMHDMKNSGCISFTDDKNSISNAKQFSLFEDLKEKLHSKISLSVANTGCIMNYPEKSYDWVRCGIGIYGGYINDDNLKTAMTLRSPIINIRKILKGECVGYDGRAVAEKDMKIASVYLGYADGLPVTIKDGTKVHINDTEASVFGKVSMDITTIDISDNKDCKVGDWCTFFSSKLPISNIAKSNDLISYFLMTSVKSRVKKIYKNIN